MIVIPLAGGKPKRTLIELAFGDLAMAGYEFGRTPEEVTDALMRLNALMLEWPWSKLGFVQPAYGIGDADELSGIPDDMTNAVGAALALRLAAAMGATLPPEARANLARSMSYVYGQQASIPQMPIAPSTPRGAGAERRRRSPFIEETYIDVNPPTGTAVVTTGNTTSGSNVITNIPDTSAILNGYFVNGSGIPAGATVTSVSATSVTISINATASATNVTLTFQAP